MNASGNRLAVGARENDGNGVGSGHVRVYEWDSTAWVQIGVDIDGEAAYDVSGTAISMNASGDRLAIGAPRNSGNGVLAGQVRVYGWDTSSSAWTQLGSDIDGERQSDQSGSSVIMNADGDRFAVGAPYNGRLGTKVGQVRVYKWNGTVWTRLGSDINGEANNDESGSAISMNGTGGQIAIGSVMKEGMEQGRDMFEFMGFHLVP